MHIDSPANFTMVKPAKYKERRQRCLERRSTHQFPTSQSNKKGVTEQHHPGVLIASALYCKYVAFFDPLDGSNNADAAICTGTIFGVFKAKGLLWRQKI